MFACTLAEGVQERVWVRCQVGGREGCFTNEGKGDSGRRRCGDNEKRDSAGGWVTRQVTRLVVGEKKRVGGGKEPWGGEEPWGSLPSPPPSSPSCSVTRAKPPSTCTSCSTMTPSRSSSCPAAALSPRSWLRLPGCGTLLWYSGPCGPEVGLSPLGPFTKEGGVLRTTVARLPRSESFEDLS